MSTTTATCLPLVLAMLAGNAAAQIQRVKEFDPFADCPFAEVNLTSKDPAVVGWAAEQMAAQKEPLEESQATGLIAALRRMSADDDPAHRRACLHLMHAIHTHDVALDAKDLQFAAEGPTEDLRIVLLLRAATPDGGELLQLFQSLDPLQDVAWEAVGGALATRRHRTFAVELHANTRPRLLIEIDAARARSKGTSIKQAEKDDAALADFPPPITYYWKRDKNELLELTHRRRLRTIPAKYDFSDPRTAATSERSEQTARMRWLATLAGEANPVRMAQTFAPHIPASQFRHLQSEVDRIVERANESLRRIDEGLRAGGLLPKNQERHLPEPTVEVVDRRSEYIQKRFPLPSLRTDKDK